MTRTTRSARPSTSIAADSIWLFALPAAAIAWRPIGLSNRTGAGVESSGLVIGATVALSTGRRSTRASDRTGTDSTAANGELIAAAPGRREPSALMSAALRTAGLALRPSIRAKRAALGTTEAIMYRKDSAPCAVSGGRPAATALGALRPVSHDSDSAIRGDQLECQWCCVSSRPDSRSRRSSRAVATASRSTGSWRDRSPAANRADRAAARTATGRGRRRGAMNFPQIVKRVAGILPAFS